jgi:hypothetical protein
MLAHAIRAALGLAGLVALLSGATARPANAQTFSGCPVFPPDNPWNRDVSNDPLDPNSAAYIATINQSRQFLHPDFGSDPTFGIPFVVVPGSQPLVPITFDEFPSESDPGPYPFPASAPVEAGSDAHSLVVQAGACMLYELYHASKDASGPGWTAGSGARFNLNSNALRPDGWTSADAAGLPIFPGLARYDEVNSGVVNHALRFTVQQTRSAYIHPATHFTGSNTNPAVPPMGLRLRLKASFNVASFTGHSRVILDALRKYGMLVADNGSSWFISGSTDARWNDTDLDQLKSVPGSAFEVVQSGPLIGQVTPTATPVASATPTVAAACTPRPPVALSVTLTGVGRLQATITAQASANARLSSLRLGTATNAVVDVPGGPTGTAGNVTVSLPANTQQIVLTVRRTQAGQAVTVPLTVTDSCGTWPTFVGGGPQALGDPPPPPPATATPASAFQAAATATRSPVPAAPTAPATPTALPTCAPRPSLSMVSAPSGAGQLQVSLSAPAAANDWLQGLQVASAVNGVVDVASQAGLGAGSAFRFPPGTRQTTLIVRRVTAGQPTLINLTVVDSCGDWPTVVGGGPDAF